MIRLTVKNVLIVFSTVMFELMVLKNKTKQGFLVSEMARSEQQWFVVLSSRSMTSENMYLII